MALTLPFSAAAWYHDRARPRSLGTPCPRSYMTARRYWAGARPALAARSSQRAASVRFCGVPWPWAKRSAIAYCARASPSAAAWRKGGGPRSEGGKGRLIGKEGGADGPAGAGAACHGRGRAVRRLGDLGEIAFFARFACRAVWRAILRSG